MIKITKMELNSDNKRYETNAVFLNPNNIQYVETDISDDNLICIVLISGESIITKIEYLPEILKEIEEIEPKEEIKNKTTAEAISYVIEQIVQEVSDIAYPKRIPSRTKRKLDNYGYRKHLSFLMGLLGDNDKPKPKCSKCKGTGETFLFERNHGQERRRECTRCKGSGDSY